MWGDIAAWFQSPGGARVLQSAIVPALAILVAGVLAALIGRAAVGAAIRRADREQAATAVAGLVEAARAAGEADGSRGDRRRAVRLRTEADVRVRLLPLPGAARAADWAAARIDRLPTEGEPALQVAQMRDALIAWVGSPRRARKLFPLEAPPAPSAAVSLQALADEDEVPAWRRTRSAERLQQVHGSRSDAQEEDTSPVRLQHAHRAPQAPIVEAEQLAQVQSHRSSAFTRPDAEPSSARAASDEAVTPADPATTDQTAPARDRASTRPQKPEWLDEYDDEAHVTQTMNLKTPPPVSASAVRDRAPSGDIVPRP